MPAEYGAVGLDEIIGDDDDDYDDDEDFIAGDDDDDDDDDDDEDEVGIDEIIGADDDEVDEALEEILLEGDDDDDDEIGARRRRRGSRRSRARRRARARRARALLRRQKAKRRKMARALKRMKAARAVDPRAVSVRRQKRNRRRRLIVPIPVTTVAAGGTAEVTIQPQRLFKCKRFIIPSGIAGDFRFTDIKVGQQSQLAASGDVPAGAFTEVTVDGYVDFDSSDIGNLIVFEVSNTDAANAHDLEGVLLGTAVY